MAPGAEPVKIRPRENSLENEKSLYNINSELHRLQKSGHIILRVTYDSDNITIEIEDDGIGIPIDKQDNLFTFYGTFDNRGFPNAGMGLGLALSKIIIDLHGGKIWGNNNQNGKGSTFGFSLPYVRNKNENINN